MQPKTTNDLRRLELYSTMYLAGLPPADIEIALKKLSMDPTFEQMLSRYTTGDEAHQQMVRNSTDMIFSTVGSAIPIFGTILQIVGGVMGVIINAVQEGDCDSANHCPDKTSHYYKKDNHKRAITGLNPPETARQRQYRYKDPHAVPYGSCVIDGWGGMDDTPQAQWAMLLNYTNDGAWIWKKPKGTVVGVQARPTGGINTGCSIHAEKSPIAPRLPGPVDPTAPTVIDYRRAGYGDTDRHTVPEHARKTEYVRRQLAVMLYLKWLRTRMRYKTLCCMDQILKGEYGEGSTLYLCNDEEMCEDADLHKYTAGGRIELPSFIVRRRQHASRFYASVRAMFEALHTQSRLVGVAKTAAELRRLGAPKAAKALEGKTKNGATAKEIAAWNMWPVAKELDWIHLTSILDWLAVQARERIKRSVGEYTSREWRQRPADLVRRQQMLMPRVPPPIYQDSWTDNLPSTPVMVAGGGILALGAYIWWRASQEGEEE